MRILTALFGAFLAAVLLLAVVDVYTPERTVLDLPLLLIFFAVWSVGFGYATVEENLKKKIIAVLIIEGIALAGTALYKLVAFGYEPKFIFGLTLGISAIIIMFLLRDSK